MTPETKIKKRFKEQCARDGVKAVALSDRYHSGYPDFLCMKDGRAWVVEAKAENGRVSEIQKHEARDYIKHGIPYLICTTENKKLVLIDIERYLNERTKEN